MASTVQAEQAIGMATVAVAIQDLTKQMGDMSLQQRAALEHKLEENRRQMQVMAKQNQEFVRFMFERANLVGLGPLSNPPRVTTQVLPVPR